MMSKLTNLKNMSINYVSYKKKNTLLMGTVVIEINTNKMTY